MAIMKRQFSYSKLSNIDPEELKSRRAQFLIYKGLQKADIKRSKPSWLGVKLSKLKIKIGKRFMKLKRGFSSTASKVGLYKQIACVLRSCKYLVHGKKEQLVIRTLPPVI